MAQEVQLSALIENEPLGRLRATLIALIAATIIIDGFDIQMIAFVSPVLIEEWQVTKADMAIAISAALAGMALGAPLGGGMGDRLGRRQAIILSVLLFGLATLAAAWTTSISGLAAMRFIGGLGFGAVLPNATALIAEWMPAKLRSYMISLMIVGVPLGGMASAQISSVLIARSGWEACFILGGVLGISLATVLYFLLPESPHFLARHNDLHSRLMQVLARAFPHRTFGNDDTVHIPEAGKTGWSAVFSAAMARSTIGLTLAFVMSLLVFYAYANWVPTILTGKGLPLAVALDAATYYNLFGLLGAVVVAYVMAKAGARTGLIAVLICCIFASLVVSIVLSAQDTNLVALHGGLALTGAALAGLQVGLYSLAAAVYPTDCRASGVGFAAGVGRLGPIVSAFAGGLLLDLSEGLFWFTALAMTALVLAMAGVLLVNRATSN